ncbi:MAG: primosomal protein N' [Cyanobacteriota bacterium]|nr:primosomal protein N' [Cyanobacteriota bacterium]
MTAPTEIAELGFTYDSTAGAPWAEVLVDVPLEEKIFTYSAPPELAPIEGDIVSVPFGPQVLGGIVIGRRQTLPAGLEPSQIRPILDVVFRGFFPSRFWRLLHWVAEYYYSDLATVARLAFPPGLLAKSQRRLKLVNRKQIPQDWRLFLSQPAQRPAREILELLLASKTGDLSYRHLRQKVKNLPKGAQDLLKRGWVESYLDFPSAPQPKIEKVVALLAETLPEKLSAKQEDVLMLLQQHQGELSTQEIKRRLQITDSILKTLEKKGYLSLEEPGELPLKTAKLLATQFIEALLPQQREIITFLKKNQGELRLKDLCEQVDCSTAVVETLAKRGYVSITSAERLRFLSQPEIQPDVPRTLTPHQQTALDNLLSQRGYQMSLLHGVTGSGKTEVYLQVIAPLLKQGQSVLVLVPEIGLTPQLMDRFRARFGNRVSVYHSALNAGERYDTWRAMLLNQAQVVVGTRSAVFAPLPNLGLIILDEEHDGSFKQSQSAPTYHARTVARRRAQLENCPLILGSATPSLEAWIQIQSDDRSHYLSLPQRVENRPLPPIEVVDLRQELRAGNRSIFSRALQDALVNLVPGQEQAILFVNRRGHSTFVSCRSCGAVLECPHCDVSLSYHYSQSGAYQLLRCHYCNFSQAQPQRCPECQSPYLKFFGAGTQKVTEALTEQFPHLRWLRFDSDTTQKKGEHRRLLDAFKRGEADILVGTQMIAKGLDVAQVTLVGIVAADSLLNFADYSAGERAFQTLTQVAGRAGRGSEPGRVILQTYTPHHPVIEAVKTHDYGAFIQRELPERRGLGYPPYGRLLVLRLTGRRGEQVEAAAVKIAETLTASLPPGVELLGPAPASILRVADWFRWHLLLKYPADVTFNLDLASLRALCPEGVYLSADVDPLHIG